MMTLLNFGHPLTDEHVQRIQEMVNSAIEQVVEVKTHFDPSRPFPEQVAELVDGLGFTSRQWQTEAFLINPPTLNVIAVTLLAELHGRMGYFPAVVRLRPAEGSVPTRFEVAEVINLQAVRQRAREER
jgi:hypothetical protein